VKMRRFVRPVVAGLLAGAVAVLAAGCFGGSSHPGTESASSFVQRVTTEFSRGQSGRLWDELLPADQKIVSRTRFIECQSNEGWNLKSFKVLDHYAESIPVGTKSLQSEAVTARVTSDDGVTTATMHAVSASGKWHWVLQPSDRKAYQSGACPRTG
jgi:hypothetical protein